VVAAGPPESGDQAFAAQLPQVISGLAGGVVLLSGHGADLGGQVGDGEPGRCRGQGAVRARRRADQHQHAATVARSITNPDRQAQTLAARGETRQARHVASVACAVGRWTMALVPVLSLEPSAVRVLTDP
jgi:hypothetical protein